MMNFRSRSWRGACALLLLSRRRQSCRMRHRRLTPLRLLRGCCLQHLHPMPAAPRSVKRQPCAPSLLGSAVHCISCTSSHSSFSSCSFLSCERALVPATGVAFHVLSCITPDLTVSLLRRRQRDAGPIYSFSGTEQSPGSAHSGLRTCGTAERGCTSCSQRHSTTARTFG